MKKLKKGLTNLIQPDTIGYNKSSESISWKTVHKVPEKGNLAIGTNSSEEDLLFLRG